MQCPTCGSPSEPGQGFCGSCGAQLPSEVPLTQQMPAAAPAAEDAQAAYEREYARYQEELAAWQSGQSEPAAPAYPAPSAVSATGVPAPVKKSKTGLIIGLVLGALLLIGLAVVALAVFGVLSFSAAPAVQGGSSTPAPVETTTPTPAGFASAEDAIKDAVAGYGEGWVYTIYEESATAITYWVGPPASEYAAAVTVSKAADGSWAVSAEEPLDFASDVPGGDAEMSSAEEAASILTEHLNAVMEDRGMDAHALTVEPFASDGASAGMANGEFKTFTIDGTTEQSDGSFWVKSTQTWTWGTEKWQYWLVPTEAGYRISDVKEW